MGRGESFVGAAIVLAGCGRILGPGTNPDDYAPAALANLGIHNSPRYVAQDLMPARGLSLVLAHPRLGHPAIRMAGEPLEVSWIALPPLKGQPAHVTLLGGATGDVDLGGGAGTCDDHDLCTLEVPVPELPVGLYGLRVDVGDATDGSVSALAVVDHYADPTAIVHISDAHVGDQDSGAVFARVIEAINALDPPADLAIFTGDGADTGDKLQRDEFVATLGRLRIPVFVVTGNHDYDHDVIDGGGIDGHLLAFGPELDYVAPYGALRLIGVSSGQDLDDGHHLTTVAESDGPDCTQLEWLGGLLDRDAPPSILFLHHPIYNGLYATVGPDAREALKALVDGGNVLAVLAGHIHATAVYDADGDDRGLPLDGDDDVPAERWPLHYVAKRASRGTGGFALLHIGAGHIDYRWHALP